SAARLRRLVTRRLAIRDDQEAAALRIADVGEAERVCGDALPAGDGRHRPEEAELPVRFDLRDGHRPALPSGKVEMPECRAVVDDVDSLSHVETPDDLPGLLVEHDTFALGASDE